MTKDKCNEVIRALANFCGDNINAYLEIGVDCFFPEGILREIPIVDTIYTLLKLPGSLWNAYTVKKLVYFCYHMKSIPEGKRKKYIEKAIERDHEFGEKLLITIDKIDDKDKIEMLVRLFRAYGDNERIDYDTFRRLSLILERVYIEDLKYLKESIESGKEFIGGESALSLSNVGLTFLTNEDFNCDWFEDDVFSVTPLGEKLYDCIFTDEDE